MPVVVIGASGLVGRHAVPAFARVSPEVRAYVRRRETAEELRRLGAKVAVGSINDIDTLSTVMDGAHTVCHLVGGPLEADEQALEASILGSLAPVLTAAVAAGVRRVLYLSFPNASPLAPNLLLRLKGLAEEALRSSGLEFAIVRSTWIYGPGSAWLDRISNVSMRWQIALTGGGNQTWAPVFVEDVAAVLLAADDRQGLRSGVWGLEGPDRVTSNAFLELVIGGRASKKHPRPRFAQKASRQGWPNRALADLLAGDSLADAPDAAAEFGIERTPLAEGLRRWRDSLEP
jgi:NADH dehydrogenase